MHVWWDMDTVRGVDFFSGKSRLYMVLLSEYGYSCIGFFWRKTELGTVHVWCNIGTGYG